MSLMPAHMDLGVCQNYPKSRYSLEVSALQRYLIGLAELDYTEAMPTLDHIIRAFGLTQIELPVHHYRGCALATTNYRNIGR